MEEILSNHVINENLERAIIFLRPQTKHESLLIK